MLRKIFSPKPIRRQQKYACNWQRGNARILNKIGVERSVFSRETELFYGERETRRGAAACNLQKWFSWKTRACPGRWRALSWEHRAPSLLSSPLLSAARSPETDRRERKEKKKRKEGGWQNKRDTNVFRKIARPSGEGEEAPPVPAGKLSWEDAHRRHICTLMTRFRLAFRAANLIVFTYYQSLLLTRPIMLNVATDRRVFEHLSAGTSREIRAKKAKLELFYLFLLTRHDEIVETMISNVKYISGIVFTRASRTDRALNGQ